MSSTQTVLFDLDGTLIDSVDLIVQSYQYTCEQHNVPFVGREAILAGMGTPLRKVLNELIDDPAKLDGCLASYREYNMTHHDTMVTVYPGVVEMIQALHRAGIRMGVVTSKLHAGARRGLKLVGIEEYMDVVIGADDVTHPKPHGEPVEKALALLDSPKSTALFVGDSLHDMHSGRAAGVATVAITWGPFDRDHLMPGAPTHFCSTPRELELLVLGR